MSEDLTPDPAEDLLAAEAPQPGLPTDALPGDGLMIEVEAPPIGGADLDPGSPGARLAQLEAALATATKEKKDNWDKFIRAAADLENYRRRAKRDLDDAKAESRTRVLKEMLPVIDNLERALAHTEHPSGTGGAPAASGSDVTSILDGVRLVLRQFTHALEKCEVTPIDADGKPFDPNLHEAIGQQESDAPPGTVVSVLQKGYKLADRLLRPALVIVARARPEAAATEPGEPDGGAA